MLNAKLRLKTIPYKGKNLVVQIPSFVLENWEMTDGEDLIMELSADGQSIIVRPIKLDIPLLTTESYDRV